MRKPHQSLVLELAPWCPQTRRAWQAHRGGAGGQRSGSRGKREGALLVVAREAGSLKGQALEDVVDERVQDGHAALGDAGVGVHLLEHLVDVGAVALNSLLGLASCLRPSWGS